MAAPGARNTSPATMAPVQVARPMPHLGKTLYQPEIITHESKYVAFASTSIFSARKMDEPRRRPKG